MGEPACRFKVATYIFGELEADSYRSKTLYEQVKILSTPHANIFVERIVCLVLVTLLD